MTIQNAKKIYCVGVGGIGVSGLARLLTALGKTVAGSDLRNSNLLDDLRLAGVTVHIGHDPKNLSDFQPDVVIYSSDVSAGSEGYIELSKADELRILKISQAEALGLLMDDKFGVSVTGTNGKSTTSAVLGMILERANLDPTVLIGSRLSVKNETEKFKSNARLGSGKYFVAESDEYRRKMLENRPQMIVITNISADHLDYYKDLEDVKDAFLSYVQSLPKEGILIYNADDRNTVDVCKQVQCHKFTFGIHHYADLQAVNIKSGEGKQSFDMHYNNELIGKFELSVPGHFNVSNALAASLAALKLGVRPDIIQQTLAEYAGIWRRFEKVGELMGKPIISDYAHHPDGLVATIGAASEFYPAKKILFVFQPHHRNRTKSLFGEFVESLMGADEVIIPEIFDVAGREHGEQISSAQLVEELQTKTERATFAKDLDEAASLIRRKIADFDVILCMGAGDIDTMARKMVK